MTRNQALTRSWIRQQFNEARTKWLWFRVAVRIVPGLLRVVRRIVRVLAVVLLMVYLGATAFVSLYLYGALRTLDPAQNPGVYGVAYEDVRIPSRAVGSDTGIELGAWFLPNPASHTAVVLVHGKDASRTREMQNGFVAFAVALRQRGFNILMIDLRGHGTSTQTPVSFGLNERHDVLGAVDWLHARGFALQDVGVLGISLGGASSIGAMADEPGLGALVTDCSFANFLPMAEAKWNQVTGLNPIFMQPALWLTQHLSHVDLAAARPVDDMGKLQGRPVLIIHGTNDMLVPVTEARLLHAADPDAEYWEVQGAMHGGSYRHDPQAYLARVSTFFEHNLK